MANIKRKKVFWLQAVNTTWPKTFFQPQWYLLCELALMKVNYSSLAGKIQGLFLSRAALKDDSRRIFQNAGIFSVLYNLLVDKGDGKTTYAISGLLLLKKLRLCLDATYEGC